jgi:hypothetical protein
MDTYTDILNTLFRWVQTAGNMAPQFRGDEEGDGRMPSFFFFGWSVEEDDWRPLEVFLCPDGVIMYEISQGKSDVEGVVTSCAQMKNLLDWVVWRECKVAPL